MQMIAIPVPVSCTILRRYIFFDKNAELKNVQTLI